MDRHLLPNEIDLLLDGDVGFGTTPLKAHVRRCEQCRADLEEARGVVQMLEHLPALRPSAAFEQIVMSQVQVYVPWHVALLDSLQRFVPRSRPARVLAGAGAVSMASILTVVSIWLLARFDIFMFAVHLGLDRVQAGALGAVSSLLSGLVAEPTLAVIRASGWIGLGLLFVGLLGATFGAAAMLRAVTARSRAR